MNLTQLTSKKFLFKYLVCALLCAPFLFGSIGSLFQLSGTYQTLTSVQVEPGYQPTYVLQSINSHEIANTSQKSSLDRLVFNDSPNPFESNDDVSHVIFELFTVHFNDAYHLVNYHALVKSSYQTPSYLIRAPPALSA